MAATLLRVWHAQIQETGALLDQEEEFRVVLSDGGVLIRRFDFGADVSAGAFAEKILATAEGYTLAKRSSCRFVVDVPLVDESLRKSFNLGMSDEEEDWDDFDDDLETVPASPGPVDKWMDLLILQEKGKQKHAKRSRLAAETFSEAVAKALPVLVPFAAHWLQQRGASVTIGAPPPTLDQQEYDKRTGEQIDALMRMIEPEQLLKIEATDAFTTEQRDLLRAIFGMRLERQAAHGSTAPTPSEPSPEPIVTPPSNGQGASPTAS